MQTRLTNGYFSVFTSNTLAGSGNQFVFASDGKEIKTGRILYKIFSGGKYGYSFLFSNITDGTYADGAVSAKNRACPEWTMHRLRVGKCRFVPEGVNPEKLTVSDGEFSSDITVTDLKEVTFEGKRSKVVGSGEIFATDTIELSFEKDEYLCLEITFSGTVIPYHEESLLPSFVKGESGWVYSRKTPVASMIGCDRKVKGRIVFFGDSITQGIGTPFNSYRHWNALFAEKLGDDFSYWNLGLGFGRAEDAASGGAWFEKAKNCDYCFVCFGVNDLLQGRSKQAIMRDLRHIYKNLTASGVNVVMQTVPPFDYPEELRSAWAEINDFIKTDLACGNVFDVVPILMESEKRPFNARFGGHPNENGCRIWAERLYLESKDIFRK
ncbi:MAG: SGNH/GDSL hydrolase family protein [Clostridia bacterium]|nr:SGNH/GDSL hydrolase family protein [Clostridia bacterium]